jgi:hypothetical protein
MSAGSATIGQGSNGTTWVNVYPQNGFSGNVRLSVAGLPSGVTASFSPNPNTGYSTITFTSTATSSLGQYNVTITGTSGTQTVSTLSTLSIYPVSFTLSDWQNVLATDQGTSITSAINVEPAYGFNGSVSFAASGLPAGVTASFGPNPTTTDGTVLTLTASSTATPGFSIVTITGTSGALSATTTVSLQIYAPGFLLQEAPNEVTVSQGATGESTVAVIPQYGFVGNVSLAVSGLPSGVSGSWSANPTSGSSVLTLTASSSASLGTATATVTGTSGALSGTVPLVVTVKAPEQPTATSLAVTAGGNAVTSVAAGTPVTLTASVLNGTAAVTSGQVLFCDATAPRCEDIHILGAAQLTAAGTATLKFIPGIGSHSYKAFFTGTGHGSRPSAAR